MPNNKKKSYYLFQLRATQQMLKMLLNKVGICIPNKVKKLLFISIESNTTNAILSNKNDISIGQTICEKQLLTCAYQTPLFHKSQNI